MYNESQLADILLEMHSLIEIYSIFEYDHPKERALFEVAHKYNMIVIAMKEDGSEIIIAEKGSSIGIKINVVQFVMVGMSIMQIPKGFWNHIQRRA